MITGSTYLERGRPVLVVRQWHGTSNPELPRLRSLLPLVTTRPNAPRNIAYLDAAGALVVRPFRGLAKPKPDPTELETQ